MNRPRFSVIVPVYNRPQEVEELLESLCTQTFTDFDVIIVEDGSSVRCDNVVLKFKDRLSIDYLFKQNSGPGPSRNEGYKKAKGDYFVVFDSDCILPSHYFSAVQKALEQEQLDAWGGPDKAHKSFTLRQRAMGYTMSSVLTTGGIRGAKQRIGWFQPRSFNMGIARRVFEQTGGFKFDRYAEDIEFSIRMRNHGFRVGLIHDAFVYHKRRTTFSQFFKQVFNFGKGRALIGKVYPTEVKITHWVPTLFTLATLAMFIVVFIDKTLFALALTLYGTYWLSLFAHSWVVNKNLWVALLSIPSGILQFTGYGIGFLVERLKPRHA